MTAFFAYLDSLPPDLILTGVLLVLLVLSLAWAFVEFRNAPVDPHWASVYDGQERRIGIVKPECYDTPAPKTLEGRVLPTRRLQHARRDSGR